MVEAQQLGLECLHGGRLQDGEAEDACSLPYFLLVLILPCTYRFCDILLFFPVCTFIFFMLLCSFTFAIFTVVGVSFHSCCTFTLMHVTNKPLEPLILFPLCLNSPWLQGLGLLIATVLKLVTRMLRSADT